MSVPRCGWCGAPTMTGAICRDHWERLSGLLASCDGLDDDLAACAARQTRSGESVGRSTVVPLPVNLAAVDARRDLGDALNMAVAGVLGGPWPRLTITGALRVLRAHPGRLRGSWVAPVLLGDLDAAVPRAVSVLKPRGRVVVRVPCPRCGAGPLRPVGGALECAGCRDRMTVGEVRRAV